MKFTTLISALVATLALATIVDASLTPQAAIESAIAYFERSPLPTNGCKNSFFFVNNQCGGKTAYSNPYEWIDASGRGKEVISLQELSFGYFLHKAGHNFLQSLILGSTWHWAKNTPLYNNVVNAIKADARKIKNYFTYYVYTYSTFVGGFRSASRPSSLSIVASRVWKLLKVAYGSDIVRAMYNTWTAGSDAHKHASFMNYYGLTQRRYLRWKQATGNRYQNMLQQVNLLIGAADRLGRLNSLSTAMHKLQTANKLLDSGYRTL